MQKQRMVMRVIRPMQDNRRRGRRGGDLTTVQALVSEAARTLAASSTILALPRQCRTWCIALRAGVDKTDSVSRSMFLA